MTFLSKIYPPTLACIYTVLLDAPEDGGRSFCGTLISFLDSAGDPLEHRFALTLRDAVLDAVVDLGETRTFTWLAVPAATH